MGTAHDGPPIKILDLMAQVSFPGWQTSHVLSPIITGSGPQATPLGGNSWKLVLGFSWILPHVPFPFADFDLYPNPVINCNHN